MKNQILAGFLLAFAAVTLYGQTCHPWEVVKLTFDSQNEYQDPYLDIPIQKGKDLLTVTFTGVAGEAMGKELTLVGCWNGGQNWLVNFAPPLAGEWQYITHSSDAGLAGKKGTIEVTDWQQADLLDNPVRNGFVQVRKSGSQPGHYFEYTNGVPFLWIGDTWWNWTKRSIAFSSFQQLVDDRAKKGFTIGQLFVPGNAWGSESTVHNRDYSSIDAGHMQHIEKMISYANSKGITVWVHAWWSREDMDERIGAEKMLRWWRYLVHRLGAYNVVWVLAGEYNMHGNGGYDLGFWKQMGAMIEAEDPYNRIISLHNTPPFWSGGADAPQWSTGEVLHDAAWLDYNQSQVGHGKYANEMIPRVVTAEYQRVPPKPIVVTEPWYEFEEGNPTGMDIRLAAWGSILSGAAGHTYGGGHIWLAHVPESPAGGGPWPLEKSFERNTLDYEGAVSMQYLAAFFDDVEWWKMAPHPELISDYPQPFCLADPGHAYVIYARYGGSLKLDMSAGSGNEFRYYWYNPGTGEKYASRVFLASGTQYFACPESYPAVTEYRDWVLYVEATGK